MIYILYLSEYAQKEDMLYNYNKLVIIINLFFVYFVTVTVSISWNVILSTLF